MQGLKWQQLLLSKLNERTKLVGATISCEGSPFEGNVKGEWRTNPHVQSYVLATDQVCVVGVGQVVSSRNGCGGNRVVGFGFGFGVLKGGAETPRPGRALARRSGTALCC